MATYQSVNYPTLGMQLTAPTTYGTQATGTTGPTPSGYPDFPIGGIGTGKASATGAETTDKGSDDSYRGPLTATEISRISTVPSDPSLRPDPTSISEWISGYISDALDPAVAFDPATGTYRAISAGAGVSSMGPAGILADALGGVFAGLNLENRLDVAKKAYAGVEGYGVAMFQGQPITVEPGLFGSYSVAGTLPSGMSYEQTQQLAQNVLGLSNLSGAYTPMIDPANYTPGAWATLAGTPVTYDTPTPMTPGTSYGSSPYGEFDTTGSSSPSSTGSGWDGRYATPTFTDYTGSATGGWDTYGSGVVRSELTGAPVMGMGTTVKTSDYDPSDKGTSSDDVKGDMGHGGGGMSNRGGFQGFEGDALGGRIGMAPGGSTDDASDDEMGDVATMSGPSGPNDSFADEDAGLYDGGGSNNDERDDFGPTIGRIQSNIVSAIQNRPMTPEERYASNAMLAKSGMTTKDILGTTNWEDTWKEAATIDISKPLNEPEAKGFTSVGDAISQGIGALTQGALMGLGFREGGEITQGFVNKDPSTVSDAASIADNRYTSVKAGSFVVNQPTNEKHKEKLDKIVADASKTAKMKKGGKVGMVDVALSDGERLIEPEVVAEIEKKHGKNFLDNLNDKGKPEVKRRQAKYGEKVGAADGGFLAEQGMELGDVGEDIAYEEYLPVSDELVSQLSKFAKRKPQRGQIKEFIKSLSPEDKLTVLYLTETQSTTDPIESMEAIGEVVKNRMESDYYDFKDLKTLDDVLLKQTKKGAFHFSGLEPSTLYARAKEVAKGVADQGLRKAAAAAQNTLDPETEGTRRLPVGTVFYTRKDAPSQWMRESKDLEFSTELGGHEFYRTFKAKEFP